MNKKSFKHTFIFILRNNGAQCLHFKLLHCIDRLRGWLLVHTISISKYDTLIDGSIMASDKKQKS